MATKINWTAHQGSIANYRSLQQITAIKYVHGWLATKKRRWRDGEFTTPLCLACNEVENSRHIFYCKHPDMLDARNQAVNRLQEKIQKISQPDVAKAIAVGVRSIGNSHSAGLYQREFVVSADIAQAMEDQDQIGWDHFMMSRMARKWSAIGPNESYSDRRKIWETKIAHYALDTGLVLWRRRNQLIHGTQEGVSKLEEAKTLETIQAIYEAIFPNSHPSHRWLFAVPVEAKLADNRTTQIAWIDSIRRLYPQQYKDIKTRIGKMDFRQEHLEYVKSQRRSSSEI